MERCGPCPIMCPYKKLSVHNINISLVTIVVTLSYSHSLCSPFPVGRGYYVCLYVWVRGSHLGETHKFQNSQVVPLMTWTDDGWMSS